MLSRTPVRLTAIALALVAAVVLSRRLIHLDNRGPSFGAALPPTGGADATVTVQSNGWPPCATVRQRQQWTVSVAAAQPDLATLPRAGVPPSVAAQGSTLQGAVHAADAAAVAHAVLLSYDPVLDGGYNFVTVSEQFEVDQALVGSPRPVITVPLGTLLPSADCAPLFQTLGNASPLPLSSRVIFLLQNGRPEDTTGTFKLENGVVAATFAGGFAPAVNGTAEQDFIQQIRALLQ